MSKRIFAGNFSRRMSKDLTKRNTLGIGFDEVILDCGDCGKQTLHNYMGFNVQQEPSLEKVEFNYKCVKCGEVCSSAERL